MQTILGATGIIGKETALHLTRFTKDTRLVSRNPKAVNPTDECVSADFYGPDNTNSMLIETVFRPLSKAQKANWLGDPSCLHCYTYTPDAGKATALLGNTQEAFGQTWHVPTAAPKTGIEWINDIAKALGTAPSYRQVSKNMLRFLGLFVPVMKESVEMYYQFDRDYVFSGKKMGEKFGLHPTPSAEAIREIISTNFSS